MNGWLVVLGILAVLGVAGRIGWSFLEKEHREARNLPLGGVDFKRLSDGSYHGAYAGGMYRWRANQCDVSVTDGKVTGIQLANSAEDPQGKTQYPAVLYERVIQSQSLQVDTISGATLTSKAYLKAVENALAQAQRT